MLENYFDLVNVVSSYKEEKKKKFYIGILAIIVLRKTHKELSITDSTFIKLDQVLEGGFKCF